MRGKRVRKENKERKREAWQGMLFNGVDVELEKGMGRETR